MKISKYDTLQQLVKDLEEEEKTRKLMVVPISNFYGLRWSVLGSENMLTLKTQPDPDSEPEIVYKMNKHAFAQLTKKLAYETHHPVNAHYLWRNPKVLAYAMPLHLSEQNEVMQLRHRSKKSNAKSEKDKLTDYENLIMINVHNENIITAVLSTNYRGLSNADALKMVADRLDLDDMHPYEITVRTYDDFYDTIDVVMLFEQYMDKNNMYGAGIAVRNSQNGAFGLTRAPIVKSSVCDNSIVSYMQAYKRHLKGVNEFWDDSLVNLPDLVDQAVELYEKSRRLKEVKISDMDYVFDILCSSLALPQRVKDDLITGLSSEFLGIEDTALGLVSAITYAAQKVGDSSKEFRMTTLAGTIVEKLNAFAPGTIIGAKEMKVLI